MHSVIVVTYDGAALSSFSHIHGTSLVGSETTLPTTGGGGSVGNDSILYITTTNISEDDNLHGGVPLSYLYKGYLQNIIALYNYALTAVIQGDNVL